MTELPWVRFYPSDWLAGTRGLSAAETGVYITLISMMYESGRPLPEDHPNLARLCGLTAPRFVAALEVLVRRGKIDRMAEGLWNKRVDQEQDKRQKKQLTSAAAANERWLKAKRNQRPANANASRQQSALDAIPETRKITLTTSEQEPAPVEAREAASPVDERRQKLDAALRRMGRLKDGRDDEEAA